MCSHLYGKALKSYSEFPASTCPGPSSRSVMSPESEPSRLVTKRARPTWPRLRSRVRETRGSSGSTGCGGLQRCLRPRYCLLPLLAHAPHCRPDTPRPDRQEPWGYTRSLRPVRHNEPHHQVAATGTQAQGCPRRCYRSVQADAYRSSTPRSNRDAAGDRGRAGGSAAAKSGPDFPDSAQHPGPAGGRSRHRPVPYPPDFRRRRRCDIGRGGGPRQAGRGYKYTRDNVRRRQGSNPEQPSAMLRVLPQSRG